MKRAFKYLALTLLGFILGVLATRLYYSYRIQFQVWGIGNGAIGRTVPFSITHYESFDGIFVTHRDEEYSSEEAALEAFNTRMKEVARIVSDKPLAVGDQQARFVIATYPEGAEEMLLCDNRIQRVYSRSLRHLLAWDRTYGTRQPHD
ncbi:MAG TPA: hypothetical protein VFD58_20635 [Blastocatellia bacterium]|nr:hypothetical protein [Blastocatellia bacterium]